MDLNIQLRKDTLKRVEGPSQSFHRSIVPSLHHSSIPDFIYDLQVNQMLSKIVNSQNLRIMATNNIVGWFEIPVNDMERAMKFYETVLEIKLERNKLEGLDMAWFPYDENGLGCSGSLVQNPKFYKPSSDGTLVYFTPRSGDLAIELSRVDGAGGKVLMPKKLIAEEIGYMGLFLDTEGNRVAIHSRK